MKTFILFLIAMGSLQAFEPRRGWWAAANPALAEDQMVVTEKPIADLQVGDIVELRKQMTTLRWASVIYDWMPPEAWVARKEELVERLKDGWVLVHTKQMRSGTDPRRLVAQILTQPEGPKPAWEIDAEWVFCIWNFPQPTSLVRASASLGGIGFTTNPIPEKVAAATIWVEHEVFGGVYAGSEGQMLVPVTYLPVIQILRPQ
jgi:hypothetical protein